MKPRAAFGIACFLPLLFARIGLAQPNAASQSAAQAAAPAPSVPMQLSWEAPSNCPGQEKVSQKIRDLVGADADQAAQSRLSAEGRIEPVGERFRLTLDIHYGPVNGTRVVEASTCEDLGGVAAVTLALLIRVERSSGAPLTASDLGGSSTKPNSDSKQSSSTASSESESESESKEAGLQFAVRAPALRADVGVLPELNYGIGVGLGLRYRGFHFFASGTYWLPQDQDSSSFPGYGARFGRASAELSGCRGWRLGQFELGPCLLLTLDDVSARGTGVDLTPSTSSTAWLSVGGGLEGLWHLDNRAALVLGLTGRVATSKPRFVSDGVGEIYRISPAAFGVILGCEWIL